MEIEEIQKLIEKELTDLVDTKLQNEDPDYETDRQIRRTVDKCAANIWELLKDLNYDIDQWIKLLHEPSDYENDIQEDDRARYNDIRGE